MPEGHLPQLCRWHGMRAGPEDPPEVILMTKAPEAMPPAWASLTRLEHSRDPRA